MQKDPIVIVAAKRTPAGAFQGQFKNVTTPHLGSATLKGAYESINLSPESIEEVYMGCVLPAGLGQAPARQATLGAGLPTSTGATTVNKVCGSGMKAIISGYDALSLDHVKVVAAGGMESMTNAPYLLAKARDGYRMGHDKIFDHMILDGLQDAYDHGQSMGVFAEKTAEKYNFSREQQDDFAIESGKRALQAIEQKLFVDEIVPVVVKDRKDTITIDKDEPPLKLNFEKARTLKPAFKEGGTVTAANSSSISDGAAAVIMMRKSEAEKLNLKPLAVIHAHAFHAKEPEWFTLAPVDAIKKVLVKTGWTLNDVDLFEINEAFAVVALAAMQDLKIPHDKVNIHGGACALGHPIGASGARILVTLLYALKHKNLKKGVACLCIGGGEATALAIECL